MRYLRGGSGPPLILLHGLMGYSFSWRFVMPVLSRQATVYAVDMLGAGFSDRPPDLDCRLRTAAGRLLRFVKAVGISSFDLLGTSHGGAVAMMAGSLSAEHSLRLRRLILVAPVNPWSRHGRILAPLVGSRFGSAFFLASVARRSSMYPYWLSRLFGEPCKIPPGALEGYAAPVKVNGSWQYGLGVARSWTADLADLASILPSIAALPTLLIWGDRDRAVSVRSAERLRRNFHNAELVVFPGVGHLPYEEAPNEFNSALLDFLNRSTAG